MTVEYLILGANGQLGLEWAKFFQVNNISFLATDRDELDITDEAAVALFLDTHKPRVVLNCAAYTNVDGAESASESAFNEQLNHIAPAKIAQHCELRGITFVHYSTDYIFSGSIEDKATFPEGYPEVAAVDPVNAYGAAKLRGEEAIRRTGTNHLIIRISWLCSAYGKNFLKTMLRLGNERPVINIVTDQFGSPTFTFDVVDATLRILRSGNTGTFHITCDGLHSWFEFAKAIFEEAEINVEIQPISSSAYPMVAKRPAFSKLNTKKFRQLTSGKAYYMKDGIKRILNELKA